MLKGHIVVVADLEIVCNIKFCREDRIVDNAGELYLAEERSVGSTNGVRVSCSVSCHSFSSFWKLRRDQTGWSDTFNEFQRCREGRQVNESQ